MIVCFSGTGNSLAVARRLQRPGEELVVLEGEVLNEILKRPVVGTRHGASAQGGDNVIDGRPERPPLQGGGGGSQPPEITAPSSHFTLHTSLTWVVPCYSWGLPPVVREVMRRMQVPEGMRHYLVATCGDDTGLMWRQWRREVQRRGWEACGAFSVQMPNTYTLMKGFDVDAPDVAEAKLRAMPARVEAIRQAIDGQGHGPFILDMEPGPWAWVKTRVIYPWFVRQAMRPGPFHHTEDCTGCGLCARQCPTGHIVMRDGHPRWAVNQDAAHDCAGCLRCYHACPRHAVAYGRATRGKGQYRIIEMRK